MARMLLIRHAPTPETGAKLTGRLPGVHLDEKGRALAEQTADRLAPLKLAAVYSSPIERTWETAGIVAARHGVEPIKENGLLEVDYGSWSGRSLKSLYPLKAWKTVQMTPSRMTFPGGENLASAQHRAVATVERLASAHGKRTVALVSHSDIIRAITAHYLGMSLDQFHRIVIAPTSVTVIDLPKQGMPTVVAVNSNGDPSTWR